MKKTIKKRGGGGIYLYTHIKNQEIITYIEKRKKKKGQQYFTFEPFVELCFEAGK